MSEPKPLVLSFARPARATPVEDWKGISADGAPPGVYVSNMSAEDRLRWKAKLVGSRSGEHQIEIRSEKPWSNLLAIVNGKTGATPGSRAAVWRHEVRVSSNGVLRFTEAVFHEFQSAIAEARQVLARLDDPATCKATLALIRAGKHPLEETP